MVQDQLDCLWLRINNFNTNENKLCVLPNKTVIKYITKWQLLYVEESLFLKKLKLVSFITFTASSILFIFKIFLSIVHKDDIECGQLIVAALE